MKNNLFLISGLIVLLSCTAVQNVPLEHYSIQVTCYKNTIEFYTGGGIKKCKLNETAAINGYQCIDWLHFFENGNIKQFETAVDLLMPDFTIPAKSIIFLNEEAQDQIKSVYLSKDAEINEVLCESMGTSTEFYDSNHLKCCYLKNDQNIQGFPCKRSLMEPVYFYYSGKIKILTLASDYKSGDTFYKKGTSLLVSEDGLVSVYTR